MSEPQTDPESSAKSQYLRVCSCVCVRACVNAGAVAHGRACVRTQASRRRRPGRRGTLPGPAEALAAVARRHEPATPRGSARRPATPRARSASRPQPEARTALRWRRPRRGHRSRARSWSSRGGLGRPRRRRGGRGSRCTHTTSRSGQDASHSAANMQRLIAHVSTHSCIVEAP